MFKKVFLLQCAPMGIRGIDEISDGPVIRVMILAVADVAVVDDTRNVEAILRSGNDPRFFLKWCTSDA